MKRVIVVLLVIAGLTVAGRGVAQLPDQPGACNYSYTYQETSTGFRIVEKGSIVVGPGGEQAEATADTTPNADCRVTTRETMSVLVDPPQGQEAQWKVSIEYNEGESFDGPLPGDEIQQNDLWLKAESGDEKQVSDGSGDSGREGAAGTEQSRTLIQIDVGSHRGQSPIDLRFEVHYRAT